jgi:hypothetical protein
MVANYINDGNNIANTNSIDAINTVNNIKSSNNNNIIKLTEKINCSMISNNKPEFDKLEGKLLSAFVYSNKVILSMRYWKKRKLQEISRMKNLAKNSYWFTTNRLINYLYVNDSIDCIKDVGKLTAKKLNASNIFLVEDLIDLAVKKDKETSLLSKLSVNKINDILQ